MLVFVGYCAIIAQSSRDMLQNGVSHRCASVKLSTKGGVSDHFGELRTSLKKYLAIWGIAAIVQVHAKGGIINGVLHASVLNGAFV